MLTVLVKHKNDSSKVNQAYHSSGHVMKVLLYFFEESSKLAAKSNLLIGLHLVPVVSQHTVQSVAQGQSQHLQESQ